MTTTDTWFVDDTLTPVNWSTAVVGGRATQRILEVDREFFMSGPDRVPRLTVWAYPHEAISGGKLAAAQTLQDTHSVPAFPSGTPTEVGGDDGTHAPLDSPAFTGVPTAPTAALSTSTNQLATTAFAHGLVTSLVDSAPGALDTLNELATALGDDANFAATVTTALAGKANLGGAPSWMNTLGKISTALNDDASFAATMATALASKVALTGQTGTVNLTGTTLALPSSVTGLTPSSVGLGNVNNTSDVNKPVSTAAQAALDAKVALTGQTGTVDLTAATVTLATTARWADSSDATKKLAWNLTSLTTATTRTWTVPDASSTLVGTDVTQTLTNKTFTVSGTTFQDNTDTTKKFRFVASSIASGQTRLYTLPDGDMTVVGAATTQTLTNKAISGSSNTLSSIPQSAVTGLSPALALVAPTLNVKSYGAVGDGSTDDTTAIQSAFTAAAAVSSSSAYGARVHFPAGTYKLTSAITLGSSGLTVTGEGFHSTCVTQATTGTHAFTATDKREIVFRSMRITGQSSGNGDGIYLAATSSTALFNCRFEDVYISGFGRHGVHTEDLCESVFSGVRVDSCGGDGFHIGDNGSSGLGGTSLSFQSCYANGNTGSGYYLYGVSYSTLTACAADSNNYSYQTVACTALSFNGCGCESTGGTVGHGFFITNGSTSITLTACYTSNVKATTGICYYVATNGGSSCSRITFIGCKSQGGTTPLWSAKVDSTCQASFVSHQPHPSAGFASTGSMQFVTHNNTGLSAYGQMPVSGDEPFVAWMQDTSSYGFGTSVVGDSVRRFAIRSDGKAEWGSGSGSRDTFLYRNATNVLKTDGGFSAADLQVAGVSITGQPRPADQGMTGWAFDPVAATTASAATAGTLYLIRIPVPVATTITKLFWTVATAGVTATAGQNFVALYDSSGNLLVSAGVDSDITSASAKTTTVSSTAVGAGYVYFAMLFNAGTQPQPLRAVSSSSAAVNLGLSGSGLRWAFNGTGRTSLPSTLTLASNSVSSFTYWAAIG